MIKALMPELDVSGNDCNFGVTLGLCFKAATAVLTTFASVGFVIDTLSAAFAMTWGTGFSGEVLETAAIVLK